MSDVLDRFIAYCKVSSQSNPLTADKVPSTESQYQMAEVVAADLRELGAENVTVDEHAYVVAHWPASKAWRIFQLLVSAAILIQLGSLGAIPFILRLLRMRVASW